jgi:uncharacterized protein YcfL
MEFDFKQVQHNFSSRDLQICAGVCLRLTQESKLLERETHNQPASNAEIKNKQSPLHISYVFFYWCRGTGNSFDICLKKRGVSA